MSRKFLTTEEVAARVRSTPAGVRYWRRRGFGPTGFRVGRRVLYDADAVEQWLEGLARESERPEHK